MLADNFVADLTIGFDRDDSEGAGQVAVFQDPNHPAGTQPTRFRNFIAPFVDPAWLQGMLQGFTPEAINDPDGRCCISFTDTDIPTDPEGCNANLTLNWDINDALGIKSITSCRNLESRFGRDADNLPFNQQVELFLSVDYEVRSQELQLSGVAFDDRLDWTVLVPTLLRGNAYITLLVSRSHAGAWEQGEANLSPLEGEKAQQGRSPQARQRGDQQGQSD